MTEIYLLSAEKPLESLALSTAILSDSRREVVFVSPDKIKDEVEILVMLADRLESTIIDISAEPELVDFLKAKGISCSDHLKGFKPGYSLVEEQFGASSGWCFASADNPADCLKAAAVAVRLGYYFMPLASPADLQESGVNDATYLFVGSAAKATELIAPEVAAKTAVLSSDNDILNCLSNAGLETDYLVLYNSADLFHEETDGNSLGKLWVKNLSLMLVTLASYRSVFPFDAASQDPNPAVIEADLNRMVKKCGLRPRFLAVLASPASIPFFYEEKKTIGAVAEEMVRDIHVRLNDDLFFDLAEGRLMQHCPAGLSAQLISTKLYKQIRDKLPRKSRQVLIVSTPHVETGIIFSTDEALIDTQLAPLLEEAGYSINLLQYREAHYAKVSAALAEADFLLYTGHGGPEGLHTHGRTLNRGDLPVMPPLVAYASACSTVGLVPHWFSRNEGLDWDGVPVDSRQVIGLSFVEKGAICFVGGATIEDLQYTTSTYSVFMESLLLKGLSVGEAVREMRNVISLYASTLLQKNPEAYRKYRWGTANAIHQQILIGDPAFVPAPEKYSDAVLPRKDEGEAPGFKVTVEIPDDRWRRSQATINSREASQSYYRCRSVEAITPYGEDVFSWGDYYRIAPDAKNVSETAVKSSFLHLSLELPPGQSPVSLKLIDAELGESECLLCGEEVENYITAVEAMKKFKLPYLLQPPIELDMEDGWAFITESLDDHFRIRWIAPLLLINEKNRSAFPLKKFVFQVETAQEKPITGQVKSAENNRSYLVRAGDQRNEETEIKLKGVLKNTVSSALTDPDGNFTLNCPQGKVITVTEQYPLYELLDDYNPFLRKAYNVTGGDQTLELEMVKKVTFSGFIYDSFTGQPLEGVLMRVFRGELDPVGDPLIEAYVGEAVTGGSGNYSIKLAAGSYILYLAAEINGKRYKSSELVLKLRVGEDLRQIYSLNQAGIVRGKVSFKGYLPSDPPVVGLKRFPKIEGEGALSKVPVNRDGSYECLVSYQDRFMVILEEEGYRHIIDNNDGSGFRLAPQEVLIRDYLLIEEAEEE